MHKKPTTRTIITYPKKVYTLDTQLKNLTMEITVVLLCRLLYPVRTYRQKVKQVNSLIPIKYTIN